MKFHFLLATGAVLLSAGCANQINQPKAVAAVDTTAIKASLEAKGVDPDEEVCEEVHQIGSRFPGKICMTRTQWAIREQQSQDAVDAVQRSTLRSCAAGAGCAGG